MAFRKEREIQLSFHSNARFFEENVAITDRDGDTAVLSIEEAQVLAKSINELTQEVLIRRFNVD